MTTYVTFGRGHLHKLNGHTLNKDCVACFPSDTAKESRKKTFQYFGTAFCFGYFNKKPDMSFFPKGIINVEEKESHLGVMQNLILELSREIEEFCYDCGLPQQSAENLLLFKEIKLWQKNYLIDYIKRWEQSTTINYTNEG